MTQDMDLFSTMPKLQIHPLLARQVLGSWKQVTGVSRNTCHAAGNSLQNAVPSERQLPR